MPLEMSRINGPPNFVVVERGEEQIHGNHGRLGMIADHGDVLEPLLDEEFYAWRFQNPLANYLFLYLLTGSEITAFLAFRNRESERRAEIIDYGQNSEGLLDILLKEAMRTFYWDTISIWDINMPGELVSVLSQLGFRKSVKQTRPSQSKAESGPQTLPLLIRPAGHKIRDRDWYIEKTDLRKPKNWFIKAISSDYYRDLDKCSL